MRALLWAMIKALGVMVGCVLLGLAGMFFVGFVVWLVSLAWYWICGICLLGIFAGLTYHFYTDWPTLLSDAPDTM